MANPQIPQGVLNRLAASVTVQNFPALNVTPAFLGREGVSTAFEGQATLMIPTLTGTVISPQPYQMVTIRIALLKTQSLAAQYEAQKQLQSNIGNITVRPDVAAGSGGLQPFVFINCAIENVGELSFNGESAVYSAILSGYQNINSALWG